MLLGVKVLGAADASVELAQALEGSDGPGVLGHIGRGAIATRAGPVKRSVVTTVGLVLVTTEVVAVVRLSQTPTGLSCWVETGSVEGGVAGSRSLGNEDEA